MSFPFSRNRLAAEVKFPETLQANQHTFNAPERLLDSVPGLLTWLTFAVCVIVSLVAPLDLFTIAAIVSFYSCIRFLLAATANLTGLRYIREWEQVDWLARYQREKTSKALAWDAVHHVVIVPNFQEPAQILCESLSALACSPQARRMTVVLAMEMREAEAVAKAEALRQEFEGSFANLWITLHPDGLPGEIPCKSSNLAWAGRWARNELVETLGMNPEHLIVTTMDADTLWHRNYFCALTYQFALNPNRHERFWQAPIRYHNNIWDINPLMRLVNAYSAAFELAYLAGFWWSPMPISSYSLSLCLLENSGYWDGNAIADEWRMYIKAFFAQKGRLKLEPIYLPFRAYATTGETFWEEIKNRYQQTLRHAWGSKEIGYAIGQMLKVRGTQPLPVLSLFIRVAHDLLLSSAGWMVIMLGGQLPLLLNVALPEDLLVLSAGWQNPALVVWQTAIVVSAVLSILVWRADVRQRPPRHAPLTFRERCLTLASFAALPLMVSLFVSIPVIQAQTRLLVGMLLDFRVSPKR
ncbi:MAG: glycosyltransferase family 2 protein [bacterium]|nr:glycosyltransferase family 2 protein [bacterium]